MIHIRFKNMEQSELAKDVVNERMGTLATKFPDLKQSKMQVTLEMQNSPFQAGPDVFSVKLHVTKGRYDGITVEKANSNLYVAVAELVDLMLEVLNRYGDRARVKERKRARDLANEVQSKLELKDQLSE